MTGSPQSDPLQGQGHPSADGALPTDADLSAARTDQVPREGGPDLVLAAGMEPVPGYVLVRRLGRGGCGEVWEATGPGQFAVALKFVWLEARAGKIETRSLELMRDVRHPNLLALFGAWRRDGYLVLAMELAEGTLLNRLNEAHKQGLPGIPLRELLEHMREAAKGLDHLNGLGIQHRDVKPQNLMLVGGGVKVGDYGLAKLLMSAVASHSGSMTPAYSAPESFRGQTSCQSDQYSLAVSYCLLRGGELPFGGNSVQLMFGHVSGEPDLSMLAEPSERAAVGRALSKEPPRRWPNCKAFVEALGATPAAAPDTPDASTRLKPAPVAGPSLGRERTPPAPAKKRLSAAVAGTGATVVLLFALAWALGLLGPPRGTDRRPAEPAGRQPLAVRDDNCLGMKLMRVNAGKFKRGSPDEERGRFDDEGPQHDVEITRPFYLGAHEVTVGQFRVFAQESRYKTAAEREGQGGGRKTWRAPGLEQTENHPVVYVTWNDAVAFCDWLSAKEGKTFDLPTEAEWEYACRAGTDTAYCFGDDPKPLGDYAWFSGNSGSRAREVGTKKPNGWGLYDMHGNVWEWCADGYVRYQAGSFQDPKGVNREGRRVLRGGTWLLDHKVCRSAGRIHRAPDVRHDVVGFRVAYRSDPRTP